MCKEGHTGVCLSVNPGGYGSAYGYDDMGGWVGGQAEYVMGAGTREDPRPDDALGHLPDRLSRLRLGGRDDRIDGVYRGCGPGRPRCRSRRAVLGAAVVIVGDMNADRLTQARSFGCETVDLSLSVAKKFVLDPHGMLADKHRVGA